MSIAQTIHLQHVTAIHHVGHFNPEFFLKFQMTELPLYVKSALALFTVSFHD
jgi:hypothetical protein